MKKLTYLLFLGMFTFSCESGEANTPPPTPPDLSGVFAGNTHYYTFGSLAGTNSTYPDTAIVTLNPNGSYTIEISFGNYSASSNGSIGFGSAMTDSFYSGNLSDSTLNLIQTNYQSGPWPYHSSGESWSFDGTKQ